MKKPAFLFISILAAFVFLSPMVRAASDQTNNLADLQSEAVNLYQAGRYDAAIPIYRRLAKAQPNNSGALKDLLVALWLGEHYQEAAHVGERLTQLSKKDVDAQFIYARALLATGQKEAALAAFKRCRELDPDELHLQLTEARVEGMLHDYDSALAKMESLKTQHPEFKDVYRELARLQQMKGDYKSAAENWDKAADNSPDFRIYRFHEAECLFYLGRREDSERAMRSLLAKSQYWPAIDFLTDAALARGDLDSARDLLEKNLTTLRPDDEPRLLKLAHIDQKRKKWAAVIVTTDRWLTLNPHSGIARMVKADALQHEKHYPEEIAIYEQILKENPSAEDAYIGIAQAENADHHYDKALEAIHKAEALDPTDPYLLISQSYYLYEKGNAKGDQEILENWVKNHPEPALPVVLYHGLTPVPEDPLLASSLHRSTAAFEDAMQSLSSAHFTPVTADQVNAWIQGKSALPDRAVFITFDDARADSLRYADPLLQQYGMRATMFVPVANVEGYMPKTASWKELEQYHDTGRWDIQSHGDKAHDHIPVDSEGRNGLFLINKEWLADEQRLESDDEWESRVTKDHESAQEKIKQQLDYTPRAFSFPEGNFGQADVPNSTQAATLNLKWAREFFFSAYHQDEYGFNVRTRDPMRLTRYEPPPDQTGAALVRHLTDQAPIILMERRLLREAAWEGRDRDATRWLDDLRKQGASPSSLWAEEARIRLAKGDWDGARALAERAVREDDSADNRELLEEINGIKRRQWKGEFVYQEDNQSRISRQFRQDIGLWRVGGLDLGLHQITGSYSEAGEKRVMEEGGGINLARNLNVSNRLSMEATGHFFSSEASAKNTYTLWGQLHTAWPESFSTDLRGGRDLYYNELAINANVITHYIDGLLQWAPPTDWRASPAGAWKIFRMTTNGRPVSWKEGTGFCCQNFGSWPVPHWTRQNM